LLDTEIPGFLDNFNSVIAGNDIEITQSPIAVQAIVLILNTVAQLSKNVAINKSEMMVCIVTFNYLCTF